MFCGLFGAPIGIQSLLCGLFLLTIFRIGRNFLRENGSLVKTLAVHALSLNGRLVSSYVGIVIVLQSVCLVASMGFSGSASNSSDAHPCVFSLIPLGWAVSS